MQYPTRLPIATKYRIPVTCVVAADDSNDCGRLLFDDDEAVDDVAVVDVTVYIQLPPVPHSRFVS